jgi:hypothetical protein
MLELGHFFCRRKYQVISMVPMGLRDEIEQH